MSSKEKRDYLERLKRKIQLSREKEFKGKTFFGEEKDIFIDNIGYKVLHYKQDNKNAPIYFDIHGGGFSWGSIYDGDLFCHKICKQLGVEVYSIDYPLSPESVFPNALEHLYKVIKNISQNGDKHNKLIIGGRSAGGNLATALCMLAKERKEFSFVCQVLEYPFLDLSNKIEDKERYMGNGTLSPKLLQLLIDSYCDDEDRKNPLCSPIIGKEELKGMPCTIIQTAELDILQKDGEVYGKTLKEMGVDVSFNCYYGVYHGFTEKDDENGAKGQDWIISKLDEKLQ